MLSGEFDLIFIQVQGGSLYKNILCSFPDTIKNSVFILQCTKIIQAIDDLCECTLCTYKRFWLLNNMYTLPMVPCIT